MAVTRIAAAAMAAAITIACAGCDPGPVPVEQLRQATVYVGDQRSHGSGVVVAPGLVLTARHVVGTAREVPVQFYGHAEPVTARIAWRSEITDMAMLSVADMPAGIIPAPIDCAEPRWDEPVAVVGFPGAASNVITRGTVASVEPVQVGQMTYPVVIIDVLINGGNSGGGVFDMAGRIRGIVIAIMPGRPGPGLPAMVPADDICAQMIVGGAA